MAADLVGQALQHRLGGRVRVDVDKTGQNRKSAPINLDRILVIGGSRGADRSDGVPFDRQVEITAIDMELRRLVPGDEIGRLTDDLPRRRWLKRFRHGFASGKLCAPRQVGGCASKTSSPSFPLGNTPDPATVVPVSASPWSRKDMDGQATYPN
jgi:hypothetical protein